jgi:site-specific recombinase XerC
MTEHAALTVLDENDYLLLVRSAAHSPTPCRDRAMVHLFWHLAPTVRWVVGLQLDDFVVDEGALLWVDGRPVALPPVCLSALGTYLRVERVARRNVRHLFCGRHGWPLRPGDVATFFRRLSDTARVEVDPLVLRRAAIDRALRQAPERALGVLRARAQEALSAEPAPALACTVPSST